MAGKTFDSKLEYNSKILEGANLFREWKQLENKIAKSLGLEHPYYQIIPIEILETTYLKPQEKELYNRLYLMANADSGLCYPSDKYLSEKMGVSERTIRNLLGRLKELKMIETTSYCTADKRFIILKPFPIELYENIFMDGEQIDLETGEKKPNAYNAYYRLKMEQIRKWESHEHEEEKDIFGEYEQEQEEANPFEEYDNVLNFGKYKNDDFFPENWFQ